MKIDALWINYVSWVSNSPFLTLNLLGRLKSRSQPIFENAMKIVRTEKEDKIIHFQELAHKAKNILFYL
ncbi:hypothetical protein CW706_02150 [Candidatus Bathyarchaeota archaeon]|nr:MAG: hypothetical protein CW706_02150 [Candidatus Bathyarchaeota archaeon]